MRKRHYKKKCNSSCVIKKLQPVKQKEYKTLLMNPTFLQDPMRSLRSFTNPVIRR